MTDQESFWGKHLKLTTVGILLVLVLLVWWFVPSITDSNEAGEEVVIFSWSLLAALLAVTYFIFSFRFLNPVQANEIAVMIFFGKPFHEAGSGPVFAPLFVVKLVRLNINIKQREFPAEPERIWRPTDEQMGEEPPEDYKPPVRITFREAVDDATAQKLLGVNKPNPEETEEQKQKREKEDFADPDVYYRWGEVDKNNPYKTVKDEEGNEIQEPNIVREHVFHASAPDDGLGRRVTAEVSFIVRWRIIKGRGTDFIVNIGDPKELERQIEDEMVSVLQRLLPNISVGQALENIAWINAILFRRVHDRTDGWGVKIEGAYLKQIQFHRGLNNAIADLSEAFYTGQAEKELITLKGEGDALAARELAHRELEGRALGYQAIAKETRSESGRQAQAAEVARAAGESESTIIVGTDGFSNLLGLGAAMTQKDKKKDKEGGNSDE